MKNYDLTSKFRALYRSREKQIDYLSVLITIFFILVLLSQAAVILQVIVPYQKEFGQLFKYFTIVFVLLHAFKALGVKKAGFFIGLCMVSAFIGEYGATSRGWFYGHYVFVASPDQILGVPIGALLSWTISIYLAYSITNLILRGYEYNGQNKIKYNTVPILCAIDAILVMNINLFTDPIASQTAWHYVDVVGEYFGIPAYTSVTWFLTVFLITLIFRTYEYKSFSVTTNVASQSSREFGIKTIGALAIMPIFVYLVFALIRYGALALVYQRTELLLIGTAGMVPAVIIAIMSYFVIKYGK